MEAPQGGDTQQPIRLPPGSKGVMVRCAPTLDARDKHPKPCKAVVSTERHLRMNMHVFAQFEFNEVDKAIAGIISEIRKGFADTLERHAHAYMANVEAKKQREQVRLNKKRLEPDFDPAKNKLQYDDPYVTAHAKRIFKVASGVRSRIGIYSYVAGHKSFEANLDSLVNVLESRADFDYPKLSDFSANCLCDAASLYLPAAHKVKTLCYINTAHPQEAIKRSIALSKLVRSLAW